MRKNVKNDENQWYEAITFNKLLEWKEKPHRKPLILQGARQVGKTTLLEQFGKRYYPAVHSLNFEKDLELGKI